MQKILVGVVGRAHGCPMKRIRPGVIAFAAVLFMLAFMRAHAVQVAPNESVAEGVVIEYSVMSSRLAGMEPEQTLYRLMIRIEKTSETKPPDFLKGKEGADVIFYSKEKLPPELYGKRVRLKANFAGDERGGFFWIREIEAIER